MSYFIITNKSDCENSSIYKAGESRYLAYKKMQAMMLISAANCEQGDIIQLSSDLDNLTGFLVYSNDEREDFRCISSFSVTPVEDVDGVEDANLDAIPDDLDLDEEDVNYVVFDIGREEGESECGKRIAVNILWDTDDENAFLPKEVEIPEDMEDEDEISDYLSDTIGYCHKGFNIAVV